MKNHKIGDKFVIEIDKVFEQDGEKLYRAKGMKSLVFDEYGLNILKPLSAYTNPLENKAEEKYRMGANDEYEKWKEHAARIRAAGQEEAWELAKKIISDIYHDGYNLNELKEIFGYRSPQNIFENNKYPEAAAKVAAWEKAKEEICVGDIYSYYGVGNFVICDIDREKDMVKILWDDLSVDTETLDEIKNDYNKTGRHFDIASMLAQIGGEE